PQNRSRPKHCSLRCSIAPVSHTSSCPPQHGLNSARPKGQPQMLSGLNSITMPKQDDRFAHRLEPRATIRCLSSTMRNLHFKHSVSSSRTLGMKRLFVCALLLFAGADLFAQQNTPPLQQQETPPVLPQQNTPPLPPPEEGAPPPMKPSTTPPPVAPIVVAAPKQPNGKIQKSLVRITSTEVEPDYRAPWNTG